MKTIYLALLQLLEAVPGIKWADLDKGQLEFYQGRPAVAFPCALIKVEIASTKYFGNGLQQVTGIGTLRIGFDYTGETSSKTPEEIRNQSLAFFDLLEEVYLAIQGQTSNPKEIGKFDRQSVKIENRNDGLKVVNMPFATNWLDKSAAAS